MFRNQIESDGTRHRAGLTAVEVTIAAALLAVLVAAGYYFILRQQQAQREAEWQAELEKERSELLTRVDSEPHKVFKFHARPLKETFTPNETIYIVCSVTNPTRHDLLFRPNEFALSFGDTVSLLRTARLDRVEGNPLENRAVFDGVLSREPFTPITAGSTAHYILELEPKSLGVIYRLPFVLEATLMLARPWGSELFPYTSRPNPPEEFPRITLRIAPLDWR